VSTECSLFCNRWANQITVWVYSQTSFYPYRQTTPISRHMIPATYQPMFQPENFTSGPNWPLKPSLAANFLGKGPMKWKPQTEEKKCIRIPRKIKQLVRINDKCKCFWKSLLSLGRIVLYNYVSFLSSYFRNHLKLNKQTLSTSPKTNILLIL